MHPVNFPWPCPACGELVPSNHDCPSCGLSAAWMDLILALDYTIRQFHYASVTGDITRAQYRLIVADTRQRHDDMVRAGQMGQAVPENTGLPSRLECWQCGRPVQPNSVYCGHCRLPCNTSDTRLLRYQTFLVEEVRKYEKQGLLTPPQMERLVGERERSLKELRKRLETAPLAGPHL